MRRDQSNTRGRSFLKVVLLQGEIRPAMIALIHYSKRIWVDCNGMGNVRMGLSALLL